MRIDNFFLRLTMIETAATIVIAIAKIEPLELTFIRRRVNLLVWRVLKHPLAGKDLSGTIMIYVQGNLNANSRKFI